MFVYGWGFVLLLPELVLSGAGPASWGVIGLIATWAAGSYLALPFGDARHLKFVYAGDSFISAMIAAAFGFHVSISLMCLATAFSYGVGGLGPHRILWLVVPLLVGGGLGFAIVGQLPPQLPSRADWLAAIVLSFNASVVGYLAYAQTVSLRREREKSREFAATLEALASQIGRYLPSQVYSAVFAGRVRAEVASERKYLTIFFSDIVGFTPMVERLGPSKMTDLLNGYLDEMVKIAVAHGGTVDKFVGDAVMVVFGAPKGLGPEKDAVAAVAMAVEMQRRLEELRAGWEADGLPAIHVRMGLHSGECTIGNFGSAEHRLDYTAIGEPVNIAARLQAAADPDTIWISDETRNLIEDRFGTESRGKLTLKGVTEAVGAYEVVGR